MLIGWREWVSLPGLGIPAIKAKIDTGARTSALHAFKVERYRKRGVDMVRFALHPLQRRTNLILQCNAEMVDLRGVTDSGGHREQRIVIRTPIRIGKEEWPIEVTLTSRDTMLFRMLLGRTALFKGVTIDPSSSYLTGRVSGRKVYAKRR